MECFGLEGTFRGHLARPPAVSRDIFNYIRLLRAPSNLALNFVSRDGVSATSLGNLVRCVTTLVVKNFFLIYSLNLPSLSLKSLLLVLSQQALLKRFSPSFLYALFKYCKAANKVSLVPSLLQAELPQLS